MHKPSLLDLDNNIIKEEILLRHLLFPKTGRYTDLRNAVENYKHISLTCKKMRGLCAGITINILNKQTHKCEDQILQSYLKELSEQAANANQLVSYKEFIKRESINWKPKWFHETHRLLTISIYIHNLKLDNYNVREDDIVWRLDNGYDITKRDTYQHLPIWYALENEECSAELVKKLIDCQSPLINIDSEGHSALEILAIQWTKLCWISDPGLRTILIMNHHLKIHYVKKAFAQMNRATTQNPKSWCLIQ